MMIEWEYLLVGGIVVLAAAAWLANRKEEEEAEIDAERDDDAYLSWCTCPTCLLRYERTFQDDA